MQFDPHGSTGDAAMSSKAVTTFFDSCAGIQRHLSDRERPAPAVSIGFSKRARWVSARDVLSSKRVTSAGNLQ